MTKPRFSDASRTQLQRAQRLHRREQRTRHRQMLVEGPQAVRELLAYAAELIRDLYVTEEALQRHADIRQAAVDAGVWTHPIDADTMRDLSADGQGLVAVADIPEAPEPATALSGGRLVLATLDISDPGNLGTIIRTADAVGADAVIVGKGSAETYSPKVIRSAAGSHFHLPIMHGADLDEIVALTHAQGYQLLAADGAGEWELAALTEGASQARLLGASFDGPDLGRPTVWLLGNEARGFAGRDLSSVDARVSIPLYGKAESLNVSVAASVCAYVTAMAQRARS